MQRVRLLILSCLLIISVASVGTQAMAANGLPPSATIGFIPGEDPEWLKKNFVELAKYLQRKVHVPFNIYISKNYNGLIDAMRDKKVDFAFLSAGTFVEAEKRGRAKALLQKVWDSPFYFSAVVSLKSSGIKTVKDLKGKRMGWVDEKSASGHLYPEAMLIKKGIDVDHYFSSTQYFGQHEASVKALLDGKVDAVAVFANDKDGKSGAWDKYVPKTKDSIQVVWISQPIPNDPFCVRTEFDDEYPRFTIEVMSAFLEMQDEPAEQNILKRVYGINGMIPVKSQQYDSVRDMVKYLKVSPKE